MARGLRKRNKSGVYHVIFRGINRQTIFESDDDRRYFMYILKQFVALEKYCLYGYCLNDILRDLKSVNGVTVRQLFRITGFSKSLIGNL